MPLGTDFSISTSHSFKILIIFIDSIRLFVPIPDGKEEDPFLLASDLSDMLHDVGVLNRMAHLTSTLKCSYQVIKLAVS